MWSRPPVTITVATDPPPPPPVPLQNILLIKCTLLSAWATPLSTLTSEPSRHLSYPTNPPNVTATFQLCYVYWYKPYMELSF